MNRTSRKGRPNLSKSKTGEPNRTVLMRLTHESFVMFEEMAELNNWSMAGTVRYCAEQYLGLGPQEVLLPKSIEQKRR